MNRSSLLPKSLFSASTLKREPEPETLEAAESRLNNRRSSRQSGESSSSTPAKRRAIEEPVAESEPLDDDQNSIISYSSSSSSSSSSDEEDLDLRLTRKDELQVSKINKNTDQLLLKLERQQSKQNKYLSKLKHINKSIRNTSRLLGYNATLLSESLSSGHSSEVTLNKRSTETDEPPKSKQRRMASPIRERMDVEEDDIFVLEAPPKLKPTVTKKSAPVQSTSNYRSTQPISESARVIPTQKTIKEIELGQSDKMDTFTIRKKQIDVVFGKKPRSLLYNIASSSDGYLNDLLLTTSLDGDLQFWNAESRKNIKTIGKSHIYDKYIENICWATPHTLVFTPQKNSDELVKMIHIGSVNKSNVEGRVQALGSISHENGISALAPVDTGSYSRNVERCSFVTGGYDKAVKLWSLKRGGNDENFKTTSVNNLNIKHSSAVLSFFYDKYRNTLYSGGADERFIMHNMETDSTIRELRLTQRISGILQSKVNPNLMLVTVASRFEQFLIYDVRSPSYDGIKLKFGQPEADSLSRYATADWHENGYTVACGAQCSSKLNFWDIRYTGVSRNTSFSLDLSGTNRIVKTLFIPNTNTVVSVSVNRSMSWLDYGVEKDVTVKTIT